jgi:hypothetical protein
VHIAVDIFRVSVRQNRVNVCVLVDCFLTVGHVGMGGWHGRVEISFNVMHCDVSS